jgi:2-haloacid dehalogenase
VDATHDVSEAGMWKPAPAAYRYVLDQHGVTASDAALIAVHPWDVHGAATAGLATGWVDRDGARYPDGMAAPDVRAGSMLEAVEGLLATSD